MLHYYMDFWKKYLCFHGRARRAAFWYAMLMNFIILAVLALMGWMLVQVNDRASRVKMPDPDNSLGIYRSADS